MFLRKKIAFCNAQLGCPLILPHAPREKKDTSSIITIEWQFYLYKGNFRPPLNMKS
jgi:hypothetical protein